MKHSLARQITRKVSLLLLAALAILFVGSFFLVWQLVYSETQSYARGMVSVYSDLILEDAANKEVPVDTEQAAMGIRYGNYICYWYRVDYAYMYVPNEADGTLTYLFATGKEDSTNQSLDHHLIGETINYTPSANEQAVWSGKESFANVTRKSQFGKEITTILHVEDSFGNTVIAGVDIDYAEVYHRIIHKFAVVALIIAGVLLGIYAVVYLIIRNQVSRPAQLLSRSMSAFITDGKRASVQLKEGGCAEYSAIASAFNSMTHDIDTYLHDINTLTREQEHQKTELDIAARIQQGFLPKQHCRHSAYEIQAVMEPAKDVGGDLYDYLPLDDHRVLVVIADVSGKGVSAAIFMAATLILVHQLAKSDLPPAEILRKTNDALSTNNAEMLFVTAFVGIYDSETRCLTYSNAGHNLPYIVNQEIQVLDAASGTLLGLFENENYPQATVQLRPGDTLLLYTDGVSETVNGNHEFYGVERLETVLKSFRSSRAKDMVSYINASIRDFAGDAEQHDDITMLALRVKDTTDLLLDVDVREMAKIKAAILALPIPRPQKLNLCLAAEECFVNICSYAFTEQSREREKVHFVLTMSDRITMCFEDGGKQFNPLEQVVVPEDYDLDTQIGGLGKLIAVSSVDDIEYNYQDQKNILTLTKYLEEEQL